MKTLKTALCSLAVAAMIAGPSLTAFAATNDDVISALKNANVPATYIIKAENYLKNNTLTEAQSESVVSDINQAAEIMKNENVTDPSKLTTASKDEVTNLFKSAASEAGLTVDFSTNAAGKAVVTVTDKDGNAVLTATANDYLMKKTGANSYMLIIGSFMIIAAAGTLIYSKKVTA